MRTYVTTDPERAAEQLAREHETLVSMQGAVEGRVDRLVNDVGEIRGDVSSLRGDVGRVASGVESLQQSMALLGRHAVLMETQAADITAMRETLSDFSKRLVTIEVALPPLIEARAWMTRGVLMTCGTVGLGLLALVIKRG